MATPLLDTSTQTARVDRPADTTTVAPIADGGDVLVSRPDPLPPLPQAAHGDGANPRDFVQANRIHVKDGSLFIDPYLVIHRRELDPANEAQLRKKLLLTYSITNPSFYETPKREAIALNLGQLVPVTLAAKRSELLQRVQQFNREVEEGGGDALLTQEAQNKRAPFGAIVRDTISSPGTDPVGIEVLKNGLAIYLLLREKLTQQGYYESLSDYVTRFHTPDQVLGDLTDNLGTTPRAVREAALKGGIDGVGQLLGLDPRYVADVKQLANHAATQDFGYNLIEHWHLGRQLLGVDAPIEQKIATGMDARITAKINEYRGRVRHHYENALPVQEQERRIADALNLVDPVQRKLMFALGYEICYSPEVTADDIAFHRGVYGLHRKAANDLRDIRGTYRIYFSGKGDLEGSMRTLVHEVAHNLWPEQFSAHDVAEIDRLANSDQARFDQLNAILRDPQQFQNLARLHEAYKAGNAKEKQAVLASANELFAATGLRMDGVFPYLDDAYELRHLVAYAQDTLQVEGDRYNKSGYDSPQVRFREVISRFAELKQVRLRGTPELLDFIAPGLNQIWDRYYIPHLEQVYEQVQRSHVWPTHEGANPYQPAMRAETAVTPPVAGNGNLPNDPKPPQPPTVPEPASQRCASDTGVPSSEVLTQGLQLNDRILAAQQALSRMGVHPHER